MHLHQDPQTDGPHPEVFVEEPVRAGVLLKHGFLHYGPVMIHGTLVVKVFHSLKQKLSPFPYGVDKKLSIYVKRAGLRCGVLWPFTHGQVCLSV